MQRGGWVTGVFWLLLAYLCGLGGFAPASATRKSARVPELALQLGHSHWITAISASPVGGLVASADEASVRLWDVGAGEVLHTLPASGTVAFSPDGSFLATSTLDRVRVWNVPRGTLRKSFGAPGVGHPLAFTAPHLLVAGCNDGKVRKWDLRKGKEVAAIAAHSKPVTLIAAQGNLLATSDGDAVIKLWDTRKRRLLRTLEPRGTETRALAFSADGRTLAVANYTVTGRPNEEGGVAIWDPETGRVRASLPVSAWALAFSSDGRRLLAVGLSGETSEWDLASGKRLRTVEGAIGDSGICLDRSGLILFAGVGTELYLVAMESGKLLRTFPGFETESRCVAASPDGLQIASGDRSDRVRIWGLREPGLVRTLADQFGHVRKIVFSPDGLRLAFVARPGGSREAPSWPKIWRTGDWTLERVLKEPQMWGRDAAFSPDGKELMVASRQEPDGGVTPARLLFWDVFTGTAKPPLPIQRYSGVSSYSQDGSKIAVRRTGGRIGIHDLDTGRLSATLDGHQEDFSPLVFSPDSNRLAEGTAEGTVQIWDLRSPGRPEKLTGLRSGIISLAYSADGKLAATAEDGSTGFWDAGSKSVRSIPNAHMGFGLDCAWLPGGRRLVTAGADGAVRIWETRSRRLIATLQVLPPVAEDELPKDWIIYTPEGYYVGSPGAERWIRWRVDGRLLPAARYAGRFRSADRIRQALRP